jgi:hypothetical protein
MGSTQADRRGSKDNNPGDKRDDDQRRADGKEDPAAKPSRPASKEVRSGKASARKDEAATGRSADPKPPSGREPRNGPPAAAGDHRRERERSPPRGRRSEAAAAEDGDRAGRDRADEGHRQQGRRDADPQWYGGGRGSYYDSSRHRHAAPAHQQYDYEPARADDRHQRAGGQPDTRDSIQLDYEVDYETQSEAGSGLHWPSGNASKQGHADADGADPQGSRPAERVAPPSQERTVYAPPAPVRPRDEHLVVPCGRDLLPTDTSSLPLPLPPFPRPNPAAAAAPADGDLLLPPRLANRVVIPAAPLPDVTEADDALVQLVAAQLPLLQQCLRQLPAELIQPSTASELHNLTTELLNRGYGPGVVGLSHILTTRLAAARPTQSGGAPAARPPANAAPRAPIQAPDSLSTRPRGPTPQ